MEELKNVGKKCHLKSCGGKKLVMPILVTPFRRLPILQISSLQKNLL